MNDYKQRIESLKIQLFEILKENNLDLATAESCTGGMLGATLTSIPGISSCYGYGFVTYSNAAKQKILSVREETLLKHGAVSPETAMEMAEGALNVSGADLAVSLTGIAGPGGGSEQKPVGLVYLGFAFGKKRYFKKLNLPGDRDEVRIGAVICALELIIEKIQNNHER